MKVGYARVSQNKQNLDMQLEALKKAGCEMIFQEKGCGAKEDREEFLKALNYTRPGDTLVVYKLSRFARSLKQVMLRTEELHTKGVELQVLTENIDTTTPGGRLYFHLIAAIDEFQREIIKENVKEGIRVGKEKGHFPGRPQVLTEGKISLAESMLVDRRNRIKDVQMALGVCKTTFYKIFTPERIKNLRLGIA